MSFEHWLAFVVAYTVISIIPGPSVFMVTGQALTKGTKAAFWCIAGDLAGGVVLVALALLGVGAILAASSTLFQIVKWAGVFYMAYLGLAQIRDARRESAAVVPASASADDFSSARAGFLVGVLNPKAILFYVAFLSQFLDPAGDPGLQFAVLVATATVIVGTVLGTYALLAAQARRAFQSPRARRVFGYTGGGCLLGGSALIATTR